MATIAPLKGQSRPFLAWIASLVLLPSAAPAKALSMDPWDWIIQHVCADASDRPNGTDPYDGCPAETHERRLKLGDPMPYLRHDQRPPAIPTGSSVMIPIRSLIAISAESFPPTTWTSTITSRTA